MTTIFLYYTIALVIVSRMGDMVHLETEALDHRPGEFIRT